MSCDSFYNILAGWGQNRKAGSDFDCKTNLNIHNMVEINDAHNKGYS
jgi:hypothetical protein